EFHPSWKPGWKAWRDALHYGVRGYPGTVADFATRRVYPLVLGGLATGTAIGRYFVAVRLSEITAILASSVADAVMPEVAAAKQSERADNLLARLLRITLSHH